MDRVLDIMRQRWCSTADGIIAAVHVATRGQALHWPALSHAGANADAIVAPKPGTNTHADRLPRVAVGSMVGV